MPRSSVHNHTHKSGGGTGRGRIDISDVKSGLLDDLDGVLSAIGVNLSLARNRGTYYHLCNPLPGAVDKKPSFAVRHSGDKKGRWRDFSGAQSGDILELIVEMGAARDIRDVYQWGMHYLGWDDLKAKGLSEEELEARRADARRKAKREKIKAEKKLAGQRSQALHMWRELPRPLLGSLADKYFWVKRGMDIAQLHTQPGALRFDPCLTFWPRKPVAFPAIVAHVSGPQGQFYAVHRTYLKPDGSDKIDVVGDENARMVWPQYMGGVIRISKGASKLSPEQANDKVLTGDLRHCRPVILVEGVEDGLAVMMACPEARIWAVVGLSNLGNVPDMPCISEFIVCRDNDWEKPQAVASFEAGLARIQTYGKPVSVAEAPIGKDPNDVILAGGATFERSGAGWRAARNIQENANPEP